MKIRDILAQGNPTLSFEVCPPKTEDNYHTVEKAAKEIAKLKPAFMSVTYGAGGGTSDYTVGIASDIKWKQYDPEVPVNGEVFCEAPPMRTFTFGVEITF